MEETNMQYRSYQKTFFLIWNNLILSNPFAVLLALIIVSFYCLNICILGYNLLGECKILFLKYEKSHFLARAMRRPTPRSVVINYENFFSSCDAFFLEANLTDLSFAFVPENPLKRRASRRARAAGSIRRPRRQGSNRVERQTSVKSALSRWTFLTEMRGWISGKDTCPLKGIKSYHLDSDVDITSLVEDAVIA